jgi:hypothetical protein
MNNSKYMCYKTGYVITCAVGTPVFCCINAINIATMLTICGLVGPVEYIIIGEMPISKTVCKTSVMGVLVFGKFV